MAPQTQPHTAQEKTQVLVSKWSLLWQRWAENSFKAGQEGIGSNQPPQCGKKQQNNRQEAETHLNMGWLQGVSCTPLLTHSDTYGALYTFSQPVEGHTTQPTWGAALLHLPSETWGLL